MTTLLLTAAGFQPGPFRAMLWLSTQERRPEMADAWLTTLITTTPQEGFELAIKLARMGVKYTQPSAEVRDKLRKEYAEDAEDLIASSQVIAINFQTVAAANGYWK